MVRRFMRNLLAKMRVWAPIWVLSPPLVLVALVSFRGNRDGAASFGNGAAQVLELHGAMEDVKPLGQHVVQSAQQHIAGRRRNIGNRYVTAQRARARSQAPDVQVMDVQH